MIGRSDGSDLVQGPCKSWDQCCGMRWVGLRLTRSWASIPQSFVLLQLLTLARPSCSVRKQFECANLGRKLQIHAACRPRMHTFTEPTLDPGDAREIIQLHNRKQLFPGA